jgi:hypothetical protein
MRYVQRQCCRTRSNEVQIIGASKANKSPADDGEWSEASTVEVMVFTVRVDPMTPIPCYDSDESSLKRSGATEEEEDKEIFSMCYECNDKVPIQIKKNGTCHGRCFYCHKRQRHLACAAVNPDNMIDGIPHS